MVTYVSVADQLSVFVHTGRLNEIKMKLYVMKLQNWPFSKV